MRKCFFKLRDYGVVFLGEREKRDGTVNVKLRVHMEGEDVGDGPASVSKKIDYSTIET